MPFTLSHAAAVLPGIRRDGTSRGPLLASALVAGSMAPDMTYFAATAVPAAMEFGDVTHGPLGLFTVDVAIAAALVGLWLMLREPLLALLPANWQGRAYTFVRGPDRRGGRPAALAARFYLSAVLGASTHVLWDAFTHFDRWGTRMVPALRDEVAGFPMYTYTQYGSSAVALVVLGWFTVGALRRCRGHPRPRRCPCCLGASAPWRTCCSRRAYCWAWPTGSPGGTPTTGRCRRRWTSSRPSASARGRGSRWDWCCTARACGCVAPVR